MSTDNICFRGERRKIFCGHPSYLELSRVKRKTHLRQAKAGLKSGVVLLSSGLNSTISLY